MERQKLIPAEDSEFHRGDRVQVTSAFNRFRNQRGVVISLSYFGKDPLFYVAMGYDCLSDIPSKRDVELHAFDPSELKNIDTQV